MPTPPSPAARPSVFLSYSHADERWKKRLLIHLNIAAAEGLLDVWEVRRCPGGTHLTRNTSGATTDRGSFWTVIEVTSRDTRSDDLGRKKDCYVRLGVEEYFLHDPLREYLKPALQGFRLVAGRYEPIAPAADGSLASHVTGLTLRVSAPTSVAGSRQVAAHKGVTEGVRQDDGRDAAVLRIVDRVQQKTA
jgi:putative restriction endonuclease